MAAKYRQGNVLMVDYLPGAAVTAGDIIAIGSRPHIIHTDYTSDDNAAGKMHAASAPNANAVYEVDKTTITDTFAVGITVDVTYATNTADVAAAGDAALGTCVKASGATDATVWVQHTEL